MTDTPRSPFYTFPGTHHTIDVRLISEVVPVHNGCDARNRKMWPEDVTGVQMRVTTSLGGAVDIILAPDPETVCDQLADLMREHHVAEDKLAAAREAGKAAGREIGAAVAHVIGEQLGRAFTTATGRSLTTGLITAAETGMRNLVGAVSDELKLHRPK